MTVAEGEAADADIMCGYMCTICHSTDAEVRESQTSDGPRGWTEILVFQCQAFQPVFRGIADGRTIGCLQQERRETEGICDKEP
jgi:hypothetical protein